jgi:predicted O-methyltransferase YrrM
MSRRTIEITPALHDYLLDATLRESPRLQSLREATAAHPRANMQISPEQGQFMALLVELTEARHAIEIGTFTGYSAMVVAAALPHDGHLIACDVNEEFTAIARAHWEKAGLAEKITLRLGPALETLDDLKAAGYENHFDFAFIDADKENTDAYYERLLALVRPGGLILNDNALSNGKVVAPTPDDTGAQALDAFNRKVQQDERVGCSLVPIGDGLLVIRKR